MGSVSSPLVKTGTTLASFNFLGKVPSRIKVFCQPSRTLASYVMLFSVSRSNKEQNGETLLRIGKYWVKNKKASVEKHPPGSAEFFIFYESQIQWLLPNIMHGFIILLDTENLYSVHHCAIYFLLEWWKERHSHITQVNVELCSCDLLTVYFHHSRYLEKNRKL